MDGHCLGSTVIDTGRPNKTRVFTVKDTQLLFAAVTNSNSQYPHQPSGTRYNYRACVINMAIRCELIG